MKPKKKYKVDSTVALPKERRKKEAYPFGDMNIGDSFEFDGLLAYKIRSAAGWYKKRHPGWEYTTRTVSDTHIRLWRTA